MKKLLFFSGIFLSSFSFLFAELDINGYIENETRAIIQRDEANDLTKNETVLGLKLQITASDSLEGYAEPRIRYFSFVGEDYPYFSDAENYLENNPNLLGSKSINSPIIMELKEAYIKKYDIIKGVDLIVGKQIIKWGTADGINPSSNVSPLNLEYPLNFKDSLGVNAFKVNINFTDDIVLSLVGVPSFTPAIVPWSFLSNAVEGKIRETVSPLEVEEFEHHIELPEKNMQKSGKAGGRLSFKVLNVDMSLGYLYTRDSLPVIYKRSMQFDGSIKITPFGPAYVPSSIKKIDLYYTYPEYQVGSFDFATELFEIGFWGEMAAFFPKSINQIDYREFYNGANLVKTSYSENILMDDKHPFVRWIVGMDYTFPGGYYFEFQYAHGFFMERRYYNPVSDEWEDDLGDFVIFRFRKDFFDDTVELSLTSIYEIRKVSMEMFKENFDDYTKTGYIINPEVKYTPEDNIEFIVGGYYIEAEDGAMLKMFSKMDEGYFKVTLYF